MKSESEQLADIMRRQIEDRERTALDQAKEDLRKAQAPHE